MKMTLSLLIAFFILSCKKDYRCNCTITSNAPGFEETTHEIVYTNARKNDVKRKCVSTIEVKANYTYTNNCTLY